MTENILPGITLVLFICLVVWISWRKKGKKKPHRGAGLVTPEVIPRRSHAKELEDERRLP